MAKIDKKPVDFVGCVVIMSAADRIGYQRGDVIDVIDAINGNVDIGVKVWDNPLFEVRFVKDKKKADFDAMKEPMTDAGGVRILEQRKRNKFKLDNVKLKDKKDVWEAADVDDQTVIEERALTVIQPSEIVIP